MVKQIFISLVAASAIRSIGVAAALAVPPESSKEPFTKDIHLVKGQETQRDLVSIGGRIIVDGNAKQDVVVVGGTLEVNGSVGGNVVAIGAPVKLGAHAVLKNDLTCFGATLDRAEGAQILGETVYINSPNELVNRLFKELSIAPFLKSDWTAIVIGIKLMLLFTWFLIATCIVLAFPNQVKMTSEEIGRNFLRFGLIGLLGFASLTVLIIILAMLCLVIIGIPLLILLIVFAILIKLFGNVSIFYFFGNRLLNALKWRGESSVFVVMAGLAFLGLIEFIPIIGGLAWTILSIIGIGATLATKFGTGQPWLSRSHS